jgi:hypothetical protein
MRNTVYHTTDLQTLKKPCILKAYYEIAKKLRQFGRHLLKTVNANKFELLRNNILAITHYSLNNILPF